MKNRLLMKDVLEISGLSRMAIRRYTEKGAIRCYRNPVTKFRYFEKKELLEDLKKLNIYSKYE